MDAHFPMDNATEHCSKTQVALLSKSKLKFAVNIINHFTKETSLLSNMKIFLHSCMYFQERKGDIVEA